MKIILAVITTLALFGFMRLLEWLLAQVVLRKIGWRKVIRFFPGMELLTWVIFTFWAVDFVFGERQFYFILVLTLIVCLALLASWYFGRDFFAGIVFKIRNNMKNGTLISLEEISGKIVAQKSTHLVIYSDEGRTLKVPYSRISNQTLAVQAEGTFFRDEKIVIPIPPTADGEEALEEIRIAVLNSPWRIAGKTPVIRLLEDKDGSRCIELQVHTLNEQHLQKLKSKLAERFQEN